eukprot:3518792-Prymnesium_polylepis.2
MCWQDRTKRRGIAFRLKMGHVACGPCTRQWSDESENALSSGLLCAPLWLAAVSRSRHFHVVY